MKRLSAVICFVMIAVFFTGTAWAQKNANAYFLLDTDVKTVAYQGLSEVLGIGASAKVGFAVYAKQWEEAGGFTVKFEWDGTKAEFRKSDSLVDMVDNEITINGAAVTLAPEANILGGSTITAGESSSPGLYTNSFALSGGTPSKSAEGFVYFAVFRTLAGFQTTDALTIKASVTVSDGGGNERFLGTRFFHVNQSVDVKPATWKQVKDQFKDF